MDMGEKYKFGLEKRIEDPMNYQTSTFSSEWQFSNQSINPSIVNTISSSSLFPPVSSVEATEEKSEQNSSTMAVVVKHSPKEDYLHMRARRGQATNSHSLAERVRREKISERMKLLQDLVPGCSKVTGKAVMLDEIINYVQSLQRQVEFLSMKLAAVNPRLDFNIEGLLSKDVFQLRGGLSSAIGFLPDMSYPQLHPSQQSLLQSGIPGMGNPSDALRRAVSAQLTPMAGYKESASQMVNAWDEDLHNIVQMTFGANTSLNTSELIGKPQDSFPL